MSGKLSRRSFLKKSAVTLTALSLPNITIPGVSQALAGNAKALVVVQLHGGLDPLLAFPYTTEGTATSQIRGDKARILPAGLTQFAPGLGVNPGLAQLAPYFGSMKVIMQTGNAFLIPADRSH